MPRTQRAKERARRLPANQTLQLSRPDQPKGSAGDQTKRSNQQIAAETPRQSAGGLDYTALYHHTVVAGWKLQPEISRMRKNKANTGTTMQKYMKSPDQKQNDKHPEINPEDTEIHKLNDRDFKIAIIKTLNEIQDNTNNSMRLGVSSQKRLKL